MSTVRKKRRTSLMRREESEQKRLRETPGKETTKPQPSTQTQSRRRVTEITQSRPQQTNCPDSASSSDDEGEHTDLCMQMNIS